MKFSIDHEHGGMTRTIAVSVISGQPLSGVLTVYDGFALSNAHLDPASVASDGTFARQEGLSPGFKHRVVVTATADAGPTAWATSEWYD